MIVSAIIPVAGRGKRFGGPVPKQYLRLNGQQIINLTLRIFVSLPLISAGVVVAAADEIRRLSADLGTIEGFQKKFKLIKGGNERQDSVYLGLQEIPLNTDIVIVHDGVRPLVSQTVLRSSVKAAKQFGACVVAVPVKETIKRAENKQIIETVPRENLWQAQTPQTFRYAILKEAHEKARQANFYSTDESALVEWIGHPVQIVEGDYSNIKITTRDDLKMARILYKESRD